jgi:DNA-binding transcriptional LysR family regulator
MNSVSLEAIRALVDVARSGGFTRAAAKSRMSQPALSRTVAALEDALGVKLLNRNTRSVVPTEVGARLIEQVTPALDAMDAAIELASSTRGGVSGNLRITADRHGWDTVLAKHLPDFLDEFPAVGVEVSISDAFVDIVSDGFDAGLRLGDLLAKDMVARKIGTDVEFAVVASPRYLARTSLTISSPADLMEHDCIGYRHSRTGGLHSWSFEKRGKRTSVRVGGRLVLNDGPAILTAALQGAGIAYLFLDQVDDALRDGTLMRLIPDWCPKIPGFRLYHAHRKHQPPALVALGQFLAAAKGRDFANA